MDMVTIEKVSKMYGEGDNRIYALRDVNLTVRQGEMLAIVGKSGSGKSTLLHIMGGVDTPDCGKVTVNGREIAALRDREMAEFRRKSVGFVFQSYHLIPVLTVEENIRMPILLDRQKPDEAYIEQLLEVLGLQDRRTHLPKQLSGGQQQRVAIARALANRPGLILADEPTGALDSGTGAEVMRLLKDSVAQFGQTLVFVTHNEELAEEADRVLTLKDGRFTDVHAEGGESV